MSRIRALFLGTPEIARVCLESMIMDPHFEVVGVVTQPDRPAGRKMQLQASPVKALINTTGIPLITPENINTDGVTAWLQSVSAEVAVVVAYGQILRQKFLDLFPHKIVNVHASLLPRWRGAAPIQRSLMAGDREGGVSLQLVSLKLDAGPILGDRRFQITEEMNAYDCYRLCAYHGANLIKIDLMDYLRGNLSAIPQDESLVTYAKKIDKAEAKINWLASASTVHNLVRGLAMGPAAYTFWRGKILKLHKTRVSTAAGLSQVVPGQLVHITEKSLIVQCGTGTLEILEVQPESRAKIQIAEYLRGYALNPGEIFGEHVAKSESATEPALGPAKKSAP